MKNIPARARLDRASELHNKAVALPKLLIANDDEYPYGKGEGYENSEGNQSRLRKLYDAQQLILEVRSFVKLSYNKDSEYFDWVHKIHFTEHHKGYISTYMDSMNNEWQKGRQSLISLLTNIVSEEREAKEIEKFMIDKTLPLRYGGFGLAVLVSMISIWLAPKEMLSTVFNPGSIFAVRVILSIGVGLLLLILLARESWKFLLIGGLFGVATGIFPFLKTDPLPQPTVNQVDTFQVVKKPLPAASKVSIKAQLIREKRRNSTK